MNKELFQQVENFLEENKDGWCTKEKAFALMATIFALRPTLVCEIGIWSGKSLIPVALSLKCLNKGRVIGIDPFSASASAEDLPDGKDKDWWATTDHERVFNVFKKWLSDTRVEPYVEVHRCRSDEFKVEKLGMLDFLHVDGSHGEKASTYDITHFAPKVRRGGFLFMDDIGWATKATALIPQYGFQELYQLDTGKMYQRIDHGIKL